MVYVLLNEREILVAGHLPSSQFCVYTERNGVINEVNKHAKMRPIERTSLVNKGFVNVEKEHYFLVEHNE